MAATAISPHMPANVKLSSLRYPWSGVAVVGLAGCFHTAAYAFGQKLRSQIYILHVTRPSLVNDFKNMTWAIRSSADGRGLDLDPSTDSTNGTTRLIRAIRDFQNKLSAKVQQIRKNFPMKLLFFLVGFYCATAFATVIGQTGDWDILSAALAVVVVEGIGALMYSASQPVFSRARSLISMFNYWKAGLSLGLFLDSFKYWLDDAVGLDSALHITYGWIWFLSSSCRSAKISASRMHEAPEHVGKSIHSEQWTTWMTFFRMRNWENRSFNLAGRQSREFHLYVGEKKSMQFDVNCHSLAGSRWIQSPGGCLQNLSKWLNLLFRMLGGCQ